VWALEWQAYILSEIDRIIGLGFDGVFLDTLYHDDAWGPNGFAAGQAGIADYRQGQKDLAEAIWTHVRKTNPHFIIITNYSGVSNDDTAALTEGLGYSDAFMKEEPYFDSSNNPPRSAAQKSIDQYFAMRDAKFFSGMVKLQKVVLMQDYNLTFNNEALVLKECARYGYLESNTHKPQNLIHIDALASCTNQNCSAVSAAGEHVSFERFHRAP
jgi:uncharacterized protein (TIGR01370 family)